MRKGNFWSRADLKGAIGWLRDTFTYDPVFSA